jgi:hypothetical protein
MPHARDCSDSSARLPDRDQFDRVDQGAGAIGKPGGKGQHPSAADLHPNQADFQTPAHFIEVELARPAAVPGVVELVTGLVVDADVVDDDYVASFLDRRSRPLFEVFDDELLRRWARGDVNLWRCGVRDRYG